MVEKRRGGRGIKCFCFSVVAGTDEANFNSVFSVLRRECRTQILATQRSHGHEGGEVVSAAASKQKGHGFDSRSGAFRCGVWMFSTTLCGFSPVLRLPPTVWILSGYSGDFPESVAVHVRPVVVVCLHVALR